MISAFLAAVAASVASVTAPMGATVGPGGYWTILSAPPAPFVMDLPAPLPPPGAAQQRTSDRFWEYARWQGRISGEAATVGNFLREREKGNYVTMRYEDKDGRFRVVYSFLRDGPGTLAKYSRNPDFVGETVRWSESELAAAMDVMIAFLRSEQVRNWSGGTGGASNGVEVKLPFTKAEWGALVARRKFKVPEPVQLVFEERSASEINGPLAPEIARGIRLFARSTSAVHAVPDIASHAKIVLRNGCFRVAGGGADGAHVLFPLGQKLFLDSGGYLAFGERESRGYARVGEMVEVHGTFAPVEEPKIVTPIRKACGPGRVVAITTPTSAQAERERDTAREHSWLRRRLPESYGLSPRATEAFIRDCAARFGGRCILSPPPPPIGPCPAGTARKQGMCRTPEGHIRPVPGELQPYLKL